MTQSICYRALFPLLLLCGSCATTSGETGVDPFEPANRAVFAFNESLDKVLLRPLASGYAALTPVPVQTGVSNFFANLDDLTGSLNASLQLRFSEAGRNASRFLLNSTIGLLGLVDVASKLDITAYRTDFGHTLATWGVGSGPYLVVPLFGPRTVRSGTGSVVDGLSSALWQLDTRERNGLWALEYIDIRADLRAVDGLISGDRYIFIRDAYLQHRASGLNRQAADDFFLADEESMDWDESAN